MLELKLHINHSIIKIFETLFLKEEHLNLTEYRKTLEI